MNLTRDQILAILTAHPDTLEIAEVPEWLVLECVELGLVVRGPGGAWKLTEAGYAERRSRLDEP